MIRRGVDRAGQVIDAAGGAMGRVELRELLTEGDRRAVLGLRRGPGSPRGFSLRYGFVDTGRVMWGENVLALDLADRHGGLPAASMARRRRRRHA